MDTKYVAGDSGGKFKKSMLAKLSVLLCKYK
jgi:hypothetical protein